MFIPNPIFFHPSLIRASKNFWILTPKNALKALGNKIRVVHPGSGSRLFTHPGSLILDPRVKKATDPGSRSATLYWRYTVHPESGSVCFLALLDPETLVIGMDPDPDLSITVYTGCLSRLSPTFVHPGSRIRIFPSRIPDQYKKFKYLFNPKNAFYTQGYMIRIVHLGSDPDF